MKKNYDTIIIGSGLTGLTASLSLASLNYTVALIDPKPLIFTKKKYPDNRTTAISSGSVSFYKKIGCWEKLKFYMCPIKKILVEESSSDIQAYFGSQSQSQNAMGHMIENKNFLNILLELTRKNKNIFKYDSKLLDYRRTEKQVFAYLENNRIIEGKLIIAADGRNSYVRKLADIKYNYKDYNQKAFTFDVKHTKKHHNLAVEKFIEQGPLAILPIIRKNTQKYSSVVWSCNHPNYYEYLDKGNKKIRTLLEHYFMKFYGNINLVSKVSTWDLSLIHSKKYTDHRVLLLGDAAHSIHPLAGQGFNLTVRGIKKV